MSNTDTYGIVTQDDVCIKNEPLHVLVIIFHDASGINALVDDVDSFHRSAWRRIIRKTSCLENMWRQGEIPG